MSLVGEKKNEKKGSPRGGFCGQSLGGGGCEHNNNSTVKLQPPFGVQCYPYDEERVLGFSRKMLILENFYFD